MDNLIRSAISAALNRNWEEAIKLNKEILKENEDNIDTMNRLAYALTQNGKVDEAKKLYKKILNIDRYNSIAQKNLEKISTSVKKTKKSTDFQKPAFTSPGLFIEEPGKTKSINLTHIAPLSVVSSLTIGDEVILFPKKHSIDVKDTNNAYIGDLPDDISFRLLRFIKAGNKYQCFIKNITKNSLTIFIIEAARGKKYIDQPSFITLNHDDKSHKKYSEKEDEEESSNERKSDQEDGWEE